MSLISKIQKIVLTAGLVLALAGCSTKEVRKENSSEKSIEGVVTSKRYVEEHYLNPKDDITPMKDIDPLFDLKKGRFITKQEEQFIITYETPLFTFKEDCKDRYNKFNEGDRVIVRYVEVYEATYDDKDGDGKKELIERKKVGYEIR